MISIEEWDATSGKHVVSVSKKIANILTAANFSHASVVDVGSNVGKFLELLQDYGISVTGAVLCDMVPQLTEYTRVKFPHFHSINFAVSNVDGDEVKFLNLIDHDNNLGLSRIVASAGASDAYRLFSVNTITIGTVIRKYSISPNVVKIDAEGHDLTVLDSVIEYMESGGECRPLIVFECSGQSDTAALVSRLKDLKHLRTS